MLAQISEIFVKDSADEYGVKDSFEASSRDDVRSDDYDDDDDDEKADEASKEDRIEDEDRVTLSWNNVCVRTSIGGGKSASSSSSKDILVDVEGLVRPGSLVALMGASGAGKTTLLNTLNFRNLAGLKVTGDIMINGHRVDQKQMSQVSVFVQQEDVFVGTLTVKEHLTFHAKLRMKHSSRAEILRRVDDVMVQMGLKKCENVLIGVPEKIKGISGGEMKRLAFATEILIKPTLIFCDEPTSGLDSFMATSLVKLLNRYAAAGRTIICTIHQPSSDIFQLFDHICIMAEGKCAFIGHSKDCAATFDRAGYPCPANYNPSDHYVFLLAVVPGKEADCRQKVAKITAAYHDSPEYGELRRKVAELMESPESDAFRRKIRKLSCGRKVGHTFTQFGQILYRQFKTTLRDPNAFFIRFAVTMAMSIIVGLTWFKLDLRDEGSRQNIPGCIFFLSTFIFMSCALLVVVVIPNESPVLTRDYLSGVYPIPIYYFGVLFFYTIEVVLNATIIFHIIYWMVFHGTLVNEETAYPGVYATTLLHSLVGISVGMLISSIATSFSMAFSLANAFQTVLMLYSGFLILDGDIPDAARIFQYLSSWYYTINVNMHLLYENVPAPCERPAFSNTTLDDLEKELERREPDQETLKELVSDLCLPKTDCDNYMSGKESVGHFDFEERNTMNQVAMICLALGYNIVALTVLTVKMWCKRR